MATKLDDVSGNENPLIPDDEQRSNSLNQDEEDTAYPQSNAQAGGSPADEAAAYLAQQEGLSRPLTDENLGEIPVEKSKSPDELESAEQTGDTGGGSYFNPDVHAGEGLIRRTIASRNKGTSSKKSRKKLFLILGGFGGLGILGVLAVIFFLIGMLEIPDFTTHIFEYQFAKVASEFQDSVEQTYGESTFLDTASEAEAQTIASRFSSLSDGLMTKTLQFRPKALVDNLETTGKLDYVYEPTGTTILGVQRERLTAIVLDGQRIDVSNPTAFEKLISPIDSLQSKFQFSGELSDALSTSLDRTNTVIRGLAGREIRSRIDANLFRWVRSGKADDPSDPDNYDNVPPEQADGLNAEKSFNVAVDEGGPASVATVGTQGEVDGNLKGAEQGSIEAEAKTLQTEAGREQAAATGQLAATAIEQIDSGLNTSALQSAAKSFGDVNTVYAVALPLCIIYDGSLDNSKGSIDANSNELERTYYSVAAGGDQAKAGGQITSGAYGALASQLGNINQSNPEIRASGQPVNTLTSGISPQASAGGTYSLFNVILGNGPFSALSGVFNDTIKPFCGTITNVWGALAAGGVGIALSLITGLQSTALKEGVDAASTEALSVYMSQLVSKLSVSGVIDELKSFVAVGAGTAVLTELAKIVVAERAGVFNNGLAQGTTFANQVDAGGNIAANEYNREMFMGRPLTTPEAAAAQSAGQQAVTAQNASKPAFDRYFALSNPDSLVSKVGLALHADNNRSFLAAMVAETAKLFNPGLLFSKLAGLFNGRTAWAAQAAGNADTQNYGILQWGWSTSEENLMNSNPDYYPLVNEQTLEGIVICVKRDPATHHCIQSENAKQYTPEHFGECFGYTYSPTVNTEAILNPGATVGSLLSSGKITRDDQGNVNPTVGECSPVNLGQNSPEASSLDCIAGCSELPNMIFRWRIAMRNDNTLDHLLGLQNPG